MCAATSQDINIVRDLAKRYLDIANDPVQEERRDLWRKKNSLKAVRPLIYVRAFAWREMPESKCECEDPVLRGCEDFFRRNLFIDTFGDDTIFEPWVTSGATHVLPEAGPWGVRQTMTASTEERGAKKFDPAIRDLDDIEKLVAPHHVIDEEATARKLEQVRDAVGDIITVAPSRRPHFWTWHADISNNLAYLRGLEQIMWDMIDNPEWLHRLLGFMRDGVLRAQQEAEDAADYTLLDHYNQAQPYSKELSDPSADGKSVTRDQLWCFCASQETTLVGPDLFEEFMLNYQRPIVEKYGLLAYGCCEDLTPKIPLLKKIPNLRRIAVALTADVAKCAEQIGTDYVFSYRPSPADMVGYGFDADRIRRIVKGDLEKARGCHVDITLKDVETVGGDADRIRNWVKLVREIIDEVCY